MILFDKEFTSTIEAIQDQLLAYIYITTGKHGTVQNFDNILENGSTDEPITVSSNNDSILMMYTSGTTGKPKGAIFSHLNLLAASIGLTHTIDWWEQDRFLSVAPFFHIGGFAPLITNVHTGATTILMEDFDPIAVWKTIEVEQITTMMTVPAMLSFMLKVFNNVNPTYSSLRNITCGASAVPSQLIATFKQLGISVQQVYGITEYCGAVSFWKESMNSEKYDSMGKSVMHGALKIVNPETGEELPNGVNGEIICSGPQVFKGYLKNEEAYSKVVVNGWYHTGDIGRIDEEGFLYVIDRLKDMIISGGENIYSAEIEAQLITHPAIVEAAVIGVPNQKWGEIPRAYVVVSQGAYLSEEDVISFCKEHLAAYKAVKEVIFIEQLPRNAVGKVLKNTLKDKDPLLQ